MAGKRKKGEGTLRLRKDGRWEGRVVVGYNEAGAPKTKNVLAKSKKECLSKLKGLMEQYHDPISERIQPSMTFGAWLDLWYQNDSRPKLRKTTQQHYENLIYHHLIPSVGDIPLDQLTLGDLQQFFKRMKDCGRLTHTEQRGAGLSDRTVRSCHAVCQMALDKAVEERLIYRNPAVGCKLPSLKSKEMKVLTQQEIQRFLIQAKAEGMYELFLLELTTGMRRGELLALRWDDLDVTTGKLRIDKQVYPVGGKLVISEPKTKAAVRTIILPPAMVEVLAEYQKRIFSDLMFPSRLKPEQPIDPGYVRKRLQVILDQAGCKRVRFHDLRHPYVKHTTKIFSLRLMDFQAQAYPDARRKTRGACQLHRGGQSRSPVRPLCNRKRFSCLPPQSKMSWILYAISMRLSGYTSTRSISSSASSVVSVSASKIALDASLRLSRRACSSCFCFACANTAA